VRGNRRRVSFLRVGSLVAGGLLAGLVGFCGTSYWFAQHSRTGGGVALSPAQTIARYFIPSPQDLFGKDRLSILLLGVDYNYDNRDLPFSKDARSDTIMAVSLDFPTKTVRELSVPRDMDAVLANGREDKINAAYADGGSAEAKQVVAGFLGLPAFDRYVVLRVDATRDLIDALGGVDIDVMNSDALKHSGPNGPVNYDDNWGHLHVHLKPGVQHLTGAEAVGYARFRHDWCSDPCRIMRQQQVTRAVLAQIEHNQLNTLVHVQSLLGVVHKDVETDLSPQEELSLATEFANVAPSSIKTEQVAYTGDKDLPLAGSVIIPDDAAKTAQVARLFGPEPPPVPAPGQQDLAAIAPATVHVTIENGSGEQGLAGKVAQALRSRGYVIDAVRDADSFGYETTEIHATGTRPFVGEKVRTELGVPQSDLKLDGSALTAGGSDVTVVVGRDYPVR
jgi:LCP family protein required for cell wall assembly